MEVLNAFLSHLSLLSPPAVPGQDADHPLDLLAVPGLMTLLDVALYRSAEGQLTATTCSGHALLQAWLDVKHQAQLILQQTSEEVSVSEAAERLARLCLEAAGDATERLTTDKLAHSANLSDPYDNAASGGSNHVLSGVGQQGLVTGVLESKGDTGRRFPSEQRPKDCWESARLFCPDYVWADDVVVTCQRLLRNLTKHSLYDDVVELPLAGTSSSSSSSHSKSTTLSPRAERHLAVLLQLIQDDIPMRLHQFKLATEADAVVSKRLYLVKCEYRAPFRAFLEAHQSVQRAPSVEIVDDYLANLPTNQRQAKREQAQAKLQHLLETPPLVEALALERKCEELELDMAQALFPFTELARMVEHKRAKLVEVQGVIDEDQVTELQELLRRLKYLLCRRAGPETSTGIRPLLLDIRGMPRDEDPLRSTTTPPSLSLDGPSLRRLKTLVQKLQLLGTLMQTKHAFATDKRADVDFPAAIAKGCTDDFDGPLLECQVQDYFALVTQQTALVKSHQLEALEASIRKAEMEVSIAVASDNSLTMVRQRLELLATDRSKRFDVLQQMVEEVCLREMNLHVQVQAPDKGRTLLLQPTSALGLFGAALQVAGEPLPIG